MVLAFGPAGVGWLPKRTGSRCARYRFCCCCCRCCCRCGSCSGAVVQVCNSPPDTTDSSQRTLVKCAKHFVMPYTLAPCAMVFEAGQRHMTKVVNVDAGCEAIKIGFFFATEASFEEVADADPGARDKRYEARSAKRLNAQK